MSPNRLRGPFSLVCWNVLADSHIRDDWYPYTAKTELRGQTRRSRVLDQLAQLNADVMALQEVAPSLVADLRAAFPDHGLAFAPHNGEGLAVLVRGANPWSRVLTLPGGRKRALLVHLPTGHTLINLHLTWTGATSAGDPRRGLIQLQAAMDYGPDVLVGDFNAFPDWPERAHARAAGFVEAGPPGATCNVHRWLQPLDAILTRPGWLSQPRPLPRIATDTPMPSTKHPSDHLPLFTQLTPPRA